MANIKELRGRIKSVGNIAKITKAMEMVASMKLRKIQNRALAIRPYTEELRGLLGHLAGTVAGATEDVMELPLFQKRAVQTIGIFLVTSDRGLCGAYNSNVFAQVHAFEAQLAETNPGAKLKFYVYGKKGYAYLGRRGYDVERFYAEPPLDALEFSAARVVGRDLVEDFAAGKIDDVRIAFTAFTSVARFTPRVDAFLPVTEELVSDAIEGAETSHAKTDYLLEPDPETLLQRIVARYLETVVFDAMLESLASEMASRRMAMKGATDAATRMGKELRMVYNRARQESITKELLDIIGGTNAVS